MGPERTSGQKWAKSGTTISAVISICLLAAVEVLGTSLFWVSPVNADERHHDHSHDPVDEFAELGQFGDVQFIDHAVGIYITKKGLKYFEHSFDELLFRNAININDLRFGEAEFEMTKPVESDDVPSSLDSLMDRFLKGIVNLKRYFETFNIQNPLLTGTLRDTRIKAEFKRIGLRTDFDQSMLDEYRKTNTVVFEFSFDAYELSGNFGELIVSDKANKFVRAPNPRCFKLKEKDLNYFTEEGFSCCELDEDDGVYYRDDRSACGTTCTGEVDGCVERWVPVAARDFSISLAGTDRPSFKLDIPFKVTVSPEAQDVQASVLDVRSNLDEIDILTSFRPENLDIPEVQDWPISGVPVIGGLKEEAIVELFTDNEKTLLENAKKPVAEIVQTRINDLLAGNVLKKISEVNYMHPPGAPKVGSKLKDGTEVEEDPVQYMWKLSFEELAFQNGLLHFGLSGIIEDPHPHKMNFKDDIPEEQLAGDFPAVDAKDQANYDFALTVNKGFINRILGMSYARTYFFEIPTPNFYLGLSSPPVVSLPKTIQLACEENDLECQAEQFGMADDVIQLNSTIKITQEMVGGWGGAAAWLARIDLPLEIDFQAYFGIVANRLGGLDIQARYIHPEHWQIHDLDKKVKGWGWFPILNKKWVKKKVLEITRKKIAELNEKWTQWQTEPVVIKENLDIIPATIGGIPIIVKEVNTEPDTGHVVLYFDYGI